MGREIKRVPLAFNWPQHKVWKGFVCNLPYAKQCATCEGEGLNAATRAISEDYYDFARTGRRWCNDITQDEVDDLISHGRLFDFTHTWSRETGRWTRDRSKPHPTAAMVNEWNQRGGMLGHDSINRWYLIERRSRRLGVYGKCPDCKGRGTEKLPRKLKKAHKTWQKTEPPLGPGWQVWETVSEGSPISQVFKDQADLVEWLVYAGYSREAASSFVYGDGWVPTMIMERGPSGTQFFNDIESASLQERS